MDPEVKKQFDELRAQLGKNVEALTRLEKLEARVAAGEQTAADLKAVRSELDAIKAGNEEREKVVRELKEKGRTQAIARDPLTEKSKSRELLGAIVRAEMARTMRQEIPAAFQDEAKLVREYQAGCLARSTITPMATTGSYLVPTVTEANIRDGLEEVSPLLAEVDFIPGLPAGGTFNLPFLVTRPSMQPKRASTDTAMTASDPVFSQLQITPYETYIYFPVDNKLFLMSAIALGGFFEGLCRDAMVDKLAYWLLRADGTASYNAITGLLNESTAAYVYSLPAGKTGFADLTAADLNKIKAKAYKRGRGPRARWLMDLEVQGVIEDIDRNGKLPVITFGQNGSARIKQNEILIEEYMPGLDESAAATGFLGYGDPATFIVAMVGGMQIASDASYLFGKNQTAFRATTIVDIKRKPVPTFILAKTAAA
jgi:HK97 family phage major capsid protein